MRSIALLAAAVLLGVAVITSQAPAWATESQVVIRATAIEPHVLRAVAGHRVNFVKRVDHHVHVEFGEDPGRHQVFQIPAAKPVWAIFHRPGTHPYVVHVYDGKTTVLHGVVEALENPEHPWVLGECAAVVMEVCVEP